MQFPLAAVTLVGGGARHEAARLVFCYKRVSKVQGKAICLKMQVRGIDSVFSRKDAVGEQASHGQEAFYQGFSMLVVAGCLAIEACVVSVFQSV